MASVRDNGSSPGTWHSPGMNHNIPHRLQTQLVGLRSASCVVCSESIHFGRQVSSCGECGATVHTNSAGLGVMRAIGRACTKLTFWAFFGAFAGLFLAIFLRALGSCLVCLVANPTLHTNCVPHLRNYITSRAFPAFRPAWIDSH